MLLPGSQFAQPFTTINSAGVPTAPTGTPTGVLVQNGTDTGVSVTVSMDGAQGIASCVIPLSGVTAGDAFYIRISAVVDGTTYVVPGVSAILFDVSVIATAVAAAILSTPANKLVTNGSGQVSISNSIPTPPTASENATAAAAAILSTPANKLVTNGSGQVSVSNSGSVDIASLSAEAIAQLAGTVVRLAPTEQLEAASLDLVKGADYSVADGTDLRWIVDTADDLTGASAVLILKRGSASTQFSGTVSPVSGTIWRISIEVDSAEISDLVAANDWTYTLNLILASSSVRNVRKPGQRARILSAT